jgi:2-oxoglutarate ferredoxin oxidoreductase subunit alpha
MTSSSSPGVSLMQEGLSYISCTELPVVVVDVVRGGPGLGNIAPSQADYNQATRGGGHGEYHQIVLAPASVQEAIDLTTLAFDLAEKYRSVVMVLMDGSLGQMMEPAELPPFQPIKTEIPDWAVRGIPGRGKHVLTSINIDPPAQERTNIRLMTRWQEIEANEVRYKGYYLEDAEYLVVGYGTAGRISLSAVRAAREKGIKVGLLRPISLAPFPYKVVEDLTEQVKALLVVEMNNGQMLEDVRLAVANRKPIAFYGRMGGMVPFADDVLQEIEALAAGPLSREEHPRDRWLAKMRVEFGIGA